MILGAQGRGWGCQIVNIGENRNKIRPRSLGVGWRNPRSAQYHVGALSAHYHLEWQRRPNMLQKRIDDQPTISRENIREAEGIFLQHLRRVGLKQTEQRNAILRTFLETREHLSIDELHRLVKKTDPRIGFTTVYRTLKLLAGCGLASEVAFHDGIARYEHQYNRRSHHHMVCTECGASVEFFSEQVGAIEREIGHKHRYVTTRHTFQIYGVCEECRDRKKTNGRRIV
jgi:Fur family ferric uptake transcriptional regulator